MSQFSKRHFHDVDIKDLIFQYKRYECLWNINNPNYKSKACKEEAWLEIADYFQKDVNEVKRKVKYLRSAYVAEKKKVDASKKSGNETYIPSLFYYTELDFLDNIIVPRKFGTEADNTDFEFDNTNISQDVESNDQMPFGNTESFALKEQEISCKIETFAESDQKFTLSPKISYSPKISQTVTSRPGKRKISGDISLNKSVVSADSPLSSEKAQYKNLYISFGNTIALHLQQLPLEIAILTMSEIHTIITKKTLEHIQSLQRSQETASNSECEDSYNELIEESFDDSS